MLTISLFIFFNDYLLNILTKSAQFLFHMSGGGLLGTMLINNSKIGNGFSVKYCEGNETSWKCL